MAHERSDTRPTGVTVNLREATVIRDVARRILDGETLMSIARHLTETGVPTVRGGQRWSHRSVHNIATNPRIAGLREHHGEVMGKAVWPALIDEDTWLRVRDALDERAGGSTNTLQRWLCQAGWFAFWRVGMGQVTTGAFRMAKV